MILYRANVELIHPFSYKPDGCTKAVLTHIYYNADNKRLVAQVEYSNGAIDWIPVEDLKNQVAIGN